MFCLKIPQTACCRGSGGVGKRGLDSFRETAELPGSSFYCKNAIEMTPTFKTPGKVTKKMQLRRKRMCFSMQNCSFMIYPLLATLARQVSPNASQMFPAGTQEGAEIEARNRMQKKKVKKKSKRTPGGVAL